MEKTVNGVRLYYRERGQGPMAVILIHGFPFDQSIWDETILLMKSPVRIIQPDLRGFGRSEAPQGVYSMQLLSEDIAALMDALDLERAILVGHSMGGYVSLAFAQAFSNRLAGLGMVTSQAGADLPERKAARYSQAEEVSRLGPKYIAETMTPKFTTDEAIQALVYPIILRTHPNGLMGSLKGMAERPDLKTNLSEITVPAVVIAGGSDQLIPLEKAREMQLGLARSKLVEIADAGHLPMIEAPLQTANAIDNLCAEVFELAI